MHPFLAEVVLPLGALIVGMGLFFVFLWQASLRADRVSASLPFPRFDEPGLRGLDERDYTLVRIVTRSARVAQVIDASGREVALIETKGSWVSIAGADVDRLRGRLRFLGGIDYYKDGLRVFRLTRRTLALATGETVASIRRSDWSDEFTWGAEFVDDKQAVIARVGIQQNNLIANGYVISLRNNAAPDAKAAVLLARNGVNLLPKHASR
jgi:hypothetical protein